MNTISVKQNAAIVKNQIKSIAFKVNQKKRQAEVGFPRLPLHAFNVLCTFLERFSKLTEPQKFYSKKSIDLMSLWFS